ncbi:MAG: hypothetical protein IH585_14990 [Anaerolineaceae bacterium]|nr:hypothetical protein [Anaerolineaceae bacterium]
MDNSINQLNVKTSYRVYLRTIWNSALGFFKRFTPFFILTDEEKIEAGILLRDKSFNE